MLMVRQFELAIVTGEQTIGTLLWLYWRLGLSGGGCGVVFGVRMEVVESGQQARGAKRVERTFQAEMHLNRYTHADKQGPALDRSPYRTVRY
jgi:hypothetical protein